MMLAHGKRNETIAFRAACLARELKPFFPAIDSLAIEHAARLRKSRFPASLEGKKPISEKEYAAAVTGVMESGDYAAEELAGVIGRESAEKVRRIIQDHLEHFDGKGPLGKKGGEIATEAYILNLSVFIQNMIDGNPNRSRGGDAISLAQGLATLSGKQYPESLVTMTIPLLEKLMPVPDEETMRMAELGRASAGIFHDMNQLMTVILANFQLISIHTKGNPGISTCCEEGMEAVERITELRRDVLSFAKGESAFRKADVNRILKEAALMLQHDLRSGRYSASFGILPEIECSPLALRLAFLNILRNAAQAIEPENGTITISTRLREGHVEVKISDDGVGMDEERLRNVFSGVTTKESGHGIGACFMKYIVEKHGGSVSYASAPGAGTTVTMLLPLYVH